MVSGRDTRKVFLDSKEAKQVISPARRRVRRGWEWAEERREDVENAREYTAARARESAREVSAALERSREYSLERAREVAEGTREAGERSAEFGRERASRLFA